MPWSVDFDPSMRHPFCAMLIGPTQCGKTQFVLKLIRNASMIYPSIERIIWCYGCYQDIFKSVKGVDFIEGLPDMSMLDSERRTLLIIDDLMSETNSSVTKIFTKGSHHMNTSVVYVSQNLFNKARRIVI